MVDKQLKDVLRDLGNQTVPEEIESLAQDATNRFVDDLSQPKPTSKSWETIMRSGWLKLAAVIVVLLSAAIVLFSNWTASPVYAFEQTLEALHSVRSLHIKYSEPPIEEAKEFWIVCDAEGEIVQARWHLPDWEDPAGATRIIVWKEGKAEVWVKDKNKIVTLWDEEAIGKMKEMLIDSDPKSYVQKLLSQEKEGHVTLTFDEPKDQSLPITVTVRQGEETLREVLVINRDTLLVEKRECYRNEGDETRLYGRYEYHAYNQPIDDALFVLEADRDKTVQLDLTPSNLGMAQGDLSDQAIAEKVARGFMEALIARDYATAERLCVTFNSDAQKKLEETMATVGATYKRIVKLGPAQPHPHPKGNKWMVPMVLEYEAQGKLDTMTDNLRVGPIDGQPDRWMANF